MVQPGSRRSLFQRRCVVKIPSRVTTENSQHATARRGTYIRRTNRMVQPGSREESPCGPISNAPREVAALRHLPPTGRGEEEPQGGHWLHHPNARAMHGSHAGRVSVGPSCSPVHSCARLMWSGRGVVTSVTSVTPLLHIDPWEEGSTIDPLGGQRGVNRRHSPPPRGVKGVKARVVDPP